MSFILEALIQAQLERQNRGVPSLYTVQTLPPWRSASKWRPTRALVGGTAAAVSAGLLMLAWSMRPWQAETEEAPPPVVAGGTAMPDTQAKPAVISLSSTPNSAPTFSIPAAPALPAGPLAIPGMAAEAAPAADEQPHRRHHRKGHKGKLRIAAKPAPASGKRVYGMAELPADVRRVADGISVAGFAHSDNPRERMAIINNRALREGEELPGGLRVERIADDGVVFSLKGYRFRKGRT